MQARLAPIDSEVLGGNVLAIEEFSADGDFSAFETHYFETHHPIYVSCKIPLERISDVQALEQFGFRLIECQIKASFEIRDLFDTSGYRHNFERVTTEDSLQSVLEIAGTTFVHDRFSVDPLIDPRVPGERYRRYVRQSFSTRDEAVYRLYDPASNETVAFKTHRYLDDRKVLLLLGGVHPKYKKLGLGVINTYCELNELRRLGFCRGTTHMSAANYDVFNVEVGKLGFRVVTTYAVMRKIYAPLNRPAISRSRQDAEV